MPGKPQWLRRLGIFEAIAKRNTVQQLREASERCLTPRAHEDMSQ
jgi:hypothetical protein